MTYELAKELKEAGFPQHERTGIGHGDVFLIGKDGLCYSPTLSELIEACGDMNLRVFIDGTPCRARNKDYEVAGNYPEEAVANLWLVLNKK